MLQALTVAESFPDHILDREREAPKPRFRFLATCTRCNGARRKFRIEIGGKPADCPDCGHVLYWERAVIGRPLSLQMKQRKIRS